MNWTALLKTLGVAAVTGAASAVHQYFSEGKTDITEMSHAAAIGAMLAVSAYLMPQPHARESTK